MLKLSDEISIRKDQILQLTVETFDPASFFGGTHPEMEKTFFLRVRVEGGQTMSLRYDTYEEAIAKKTALEEMINN